jgi:hypothetical protein
MGWSLCGLFDKYGQKLKEYFVPLLGYQKGPDILPGKVEFQLWVDFPQGLMRLVLREVQIFHSKRWSPQQKTPPLHSGKAGLFCSIAYDFDQQQPSFFKGERSVLLQTTVNSTEA